MTIKNMTVTEEKYIALGIVVRLPVLIGSDHWDMVRRDAKRLIEIADSVEGKEE